jgi:hypothetical protein
MFKNHVQMYGRVEYRPILNSALAGNEWSSPRSSREERTLYILERKLGEPGDVPEDAAKGFTELL